MRGYEARQCRLPPEYIAWRRFSINSEDSLDVARTP
jgi:hypothetical protein